MFRKLILFLRDVLDALWAIGGFAVAAAWWVGVVFKDRHPLTQMLFFIPPVAMAVFAFLWLFLTLPRRFKLLQFFMFLTLFAALGKVLLIDHRWSRPVETEAEAIRVVHWNTASGILGTESIVSTLTRDQPHILLISEPPRVRDLPEQAHYALGMQHLFSRGTMTLASHYPLDNPRNIPIANGEAFAADAYTLQGPLTLVCVDLIAHPHLDRKLPLDDLVHWLEANRAYPTLILGDFNTPRDSVAFRPLRRTFHHAYEESGRGWPYTWPVPLPLYSIDHAWLSPEIETLGYVLLPALYSDHKRQVLDINLIVRNAQPPPADAGETNAP